MPEGNKQMWPRDRFISNTKRFRVYMSDCVDETLDYVEDLFQGLYSNSSILLNIA